MGPEAYLTPEEKEQLAARGLEKLMETLRQRLPAEGAHEGGYKWSGTAGNPLGLWRPIPKGGRIGQEGGAPTEAR